MTKYLVLIVVLLAGAGLVIYKMTDTKVTPETTQASPTSSLAASVSLSPAASVSPKPPGTSSPSVSPTPRTHTIRITNNGLSSNNLTISVGDTVTFINEDQDPHQPASGPHPIHNICPGFDAGRGLAQNDKYSFTFRDAKTCPFHDHLNPFDSNYKGSIVVK